MLLYRPLPWALRQAGIAAGDEQFDELSKLLWLTDVEDGQQYINTEVKKLEKRNGRKANGNEARAQQLKRAGVNW